MILITDTSRFVGNMIACPSVRDASKDKLKRIIEESGVNAIIHTVAILDIEICQANLTLLILPMFRRL